jgi:hypothetical protein
MMCSSAGRMKGLARMWFSAHKRPAAGIFTAILGLASPAISANEMIAADLRAIANALGFLNGLPHGAPVMVGVAYGSDAKQASPTAAMLEAIPGPAQSSFKTVLIEAKDLAHAQVHLDALLIMPDALGHAALVDVARRRTFPLARPLAGLNGIAGKIHLLAGS